MKTSYVSLSDLSQCLESYYNSSLNDYRMNRLYAPSWQMTVNNTLIGQLDQDTMDEALGRIPMSSQLSIEYHFRPQPYIYDELTDTYTISDTTESLADYFESSYYDSLSELADVVHKML